MKCALFFVSSLLALSAVNGAATSTTPVEKVTNLLKDLKTKLVLDEKTEQQVYDKYACWCEKTTARKAASIGQASDDLRMLGQTILKLKGKIATLTSVIEEKTEAIAQNKKEQEEATAIRQKENEAWQAESAETKEALAAMEQAVIVLVNATSFIQDPNAPALVQEQARATAAVKNAVMKMPSKISFKNDQVALLSEFLSSAGTSQYAPQSMTVQGILKDMYDTFATDLESATKTEADQNREFEDLIAIKTAELKQAEADKKQAEEDKAEAEAQLADTQKVYDDTTEQKKADIEFFDETKAACEAKHEAWVLRSDARMEEIAGVEKAIEILTSDAARELFASAIKPGQEAGAAAKDSGMDIAPMFLQTSGPNMKAYNALKVQARKTHSLRLAALAVQVRNSKVGHFDKVIAEIDTMIQVLKDEGAADIAKRDQCKDEYKKIESTIKNVTWLIEKNTAKIDKLTKLIEKREEQKAKTIEEMGELAEQMKQMTKERTAENAAFKAAKQEDQDAITILMQARAALNSYYKNHEVKVGELQGSVKGAALLQQEPEFEVSEDQAPDATFSGKGKRKNEAKGILQILTMVIEDLDDEIKNGMAAEEQAQLEYEGLMKAADKLMKELGAKKLSLEDAISKRSEQRTDEESDKKENEGDLKAEEDYKAEITPDCDWIIGAFYKRQEAREAEMQGLVGAKEYLAGAQPAAMIQKGFNDDALSKVKFLGLRK